MVRAATTTLTIRPQKASHKGDVVTRQLLALIVSTLTLVPCAVKAQEPTPKKAAQPKSNQVYVKIILTTDMADKDRPVVESWIAKQIKKRGESKYTAATTWVPLVETGEEFEDPTQVWEGECRVHAEIAERKDGRIKVFLDGWAPFPAGVTVSLADEPGSREIVAAEKAKRKQWVPYVAVLICPPPEKPAVVDPTSANKARSLR